MKLLARFRSDNKDGGRLRTISIGERTHYKLRLSVEDVPEGVQTITYLLHPSYKDDRIRMILRGVPEFRENIASYGDFFVTVIAEGIHPATKEWFAEALVLRLSEALNNGEPRENRSQAVDDAIKQIASL